ncbi:MAG: hypothetical protein HZA03_06040 [Nitrospinae bacterium]|nr:hypothetical protein [Nitrospinota bacterium]
MEKNLELLIDLQKADDEITRMEAVIGAFPAQLSQHGSALGKDKAAYEEYKKNLEAVNKARLEKEREVEEKKAAIVKSRMKLNDVKTNQEYHAAQQEIKNMEEAIGRLEDEQLEIMERLDTAKAEEKGLKEKVAAEEKEFAAFKAVKEKELAEVRAKAEAAHARRNGIAAAVEPGSLSQYDRVFKARGRKAVAELKNGFCSACHQMVLPQLALEVRTGARLHNCPHCNRFLYALPDSK